MKGLSNECELLKFAKDPDNSEWYIVEMAICNVPAIPFSVPVDHIYNMNGNEQLLGEYLERQARTMIERYGDRRNPDPNAFAEYLEA